MTRRPPGQADSHVLPEGSQPGPACRLGAGRAGGVAGSARWDTPHLRELAQVVGALRVLGPTSAGSFLGRMSRRVLVWEIGTCRGASPRGSWPGVSQEEAPVPRAEAAGMVVQALGFTLGCRDGDLSPPLRCPRGLGVEGPLRPPLLG